MSSVGTGYDYSATTFSPDGRVFQVEYAEKAVENSGTSIAIRCVDGVVFGAEKIVISKLLDSNSNKRHFTLDKSTGLAFSGLSADVQHLVKRARKESIEFKQFYGTEIPCKTLAQRLSQYMQNYTLYPFVRPFGCTVLVGKSSTAEESPSLFAIEPSGLFYSYNAWAVGKKRQATATELGKLSLKSMTMLEAVEAIANIVYDKTKDKDFQLEMSWVGKESSYKHKFVPESIVSAAVEKAQKLKNDSMETDN